MAFSFIIYLDDGLNIHKNKIYRNVHFFILIFGYLIHLLFVFMIMEEYYFYSYFFDFYLYFYYSNYLYFKFNSQKKLILIKINLLLKSRIKN